MGTRYDRLAISVNISCPGYVRKDDPGGVFLIAVWGGQWATRDGVAVGASELRVRAALGQPTSVEHPRSGPYTTTYKYRELLMTISFDGNGVVREIDLWRYW